MYLPIFSFSATTLSIREYVIYSKNNKEEVMKRIIQRKQKQRAHFKKRLQQRYSIGCNRYMYRFMLDQVHSGQAKFLMKQSNSKSIFEVSICGELVWAVYDKNTMEFRTALELGCELRRVDHRGYTIQLANTYD